MTHATRKRVEGMNVAMLAWMIDHDYIADDCGILDFTYMGWAHVGSIVLEAMRATSRPQVVRERL